MGKLSDGTYSLTVTTGIQNLSAISPASTTSVTFNVKDALSTVANQLESDLVKAGLLPSLAESAKASARTAAGNETNYRLNVIPPAFDGDFDAIPAANLNAAFTQAALGTIIESLLSNMAGQESLVSEYSSERVAALPSNFSTLLTSLKTRVTTKSASNSTILKSSDHITGQQPSCSWSNRNWNWDYLRQPLCEQPTQGKRQELLERYYIPHHQKLIEAVEELLSATHHCLIIDGHSFPALSLPYELNQTALQPDFCLGTDDFHNPEELVA